MTTENKSILNSLHTAKKQLSDVMADKMSVTCQLREMKLAVTREHQSWEKDTALKVQKLQKEWHAMELKFMGEAHSLAEKLLVSEQLLKTAQSNSDLICVLCMEVSSLFLPWPHQYLFTIISYRQIDLLYLNHVII